MGSRALCGQISEWVRPCTTRSRPSRWSGGSTTSTKGLSSRWPATLKTARVTRQTSDPLNIVRQHRRNEIRRSFFSVRVADTWNSPEKLSTVNLLMFSRKKCVIPFDARLRLWRRKSRSQTCPQSPTRNLPSSAPTGSLASPSTRLPSRPRLDASASISFEALKKIYHYAIFQLINRFINLSIIHVVN